jgi:hypothetical protein
MDGNFRIDLEEIFSNVKTAEVLCLHFPLLRKTLVFDMRYDVQDPPVVKILPMAKSVEERFKSIRRLRPRFPQPEKAAIIPWPKYVDSLIRLGVWEKIIERLTATGHIGAVSACDAALKQLRALEAAELASAITGNQYHTIWESPRPKR